MRYFHGGYGKLKVGDFVLPPSETGEPSCAEYGNKDCRRDRVYIVTDKKDAEIYAKFSTHGNGRVYEVEPIGDLTPDPDCLVPGLSWECEKARVVAIAGGAA